MSRAQPPRRPGPGSPRAEGGPGVAPLPRATGEALRALGGTPPSNLSLALHRLIDAWDPGFTQLNDGRCRDLLTRLANAPQAAGQASSRQYLAEALTRRAAHAAGLRREGWQVRVVRARLKSRLVSGLGIANPLETSLALDRVGGYPHLPGSSVKGAVRAVAADDEGPDSPLIAELFGPLAEDVRDGTVVAPQGAVVFFDAVPEPSYRLKLDIMNPHHSDYYTGNKWPTDWQNPKPILFLAVERGTVFELMVASKVRNPDGAGEAEAEASARVDRVVGWLRAALAGGLGGKISSGYGRFEVLEVTP